MNLVGFLIRDFKQPTVIPNGAGRRLFCAFTSCERVGLRREESLFASGDVHTAGCATTYPVGFLIRDFKQPTVIPNEAGRHLFIRDFKQPTVIPNEAGRHLFCAFTSCERVGLRREESLFAPPTSAPPGVPPRTRLASSFVTSSNQPSYRTK